MRTDEPTRVARRAHVRGRRARRGARRPAGAPAVARGGLPRAHGRGGRSVRGEGERRGDPRSTRRSRHARALRPPAPLGAARLLAQPGGGLLHLPVPAAALPAARLRLLGEDLRRAGGRGAARRARRLRLRQHGLRRPRDPARAPARERDPQAAALDAAAAGDLRRGACSPRRSSSSRSRRSRCSCSAARSTARRSPRTGGSFVVDDRGRRSRVRRTRHCDGVA